MLRKFYPDCNVYQWLTPTFKCNHVVGIRQEHTLTMLDEASPSASNIQYR